MKLNYKSQLKIKIIKNKLILHKSCKPKNRKSCKTGFFLKNLFRLMV